MFQIVPALGPDMRSNCTRCGTVLRLTRADPLDRASGAHLRRPGAVRRAVAGHADEGLDRRHRARDHAGIGSARAGPSRPVAAGARRRLHHGDRAARQIRRHDLRADRPQAAKAAAQSRAGFPGSRRDGHLGDAGGAAARRVRGLHQARRPGPRSSSAPPSMRWPAHHRHASWAETAFDPHAVWEEIERRGQTQRRCPPRRRSTSGPGAVGCEGCGLVCVPSEGDDRLPALRRGAACAQARQPRRAPGPS